MKSRPERYIKYHILENDFKKKNTKEHSPDEFSRMEVGPKNFKLPAVLNEVYLYISPDDILYEGELMKYIPGFKNQYNMRYCCLNENEFMYYKNERMSMRHVFPIFSISLNDIEKVERVSVEVPV